MSGQSPVSPARKLHDADVVYLYDGSFEGFLCCVFESFAQHEIPFAVWTPQRETAILYPDVLCADAGQLKFCSGLAPKKAGSDQFKFCRHCNSFLSAKKQTCPIK